MGKHGGPESQKPPRASRRRLAAGGGLLGVAVLACGLAAQFPAAGSPQSSLTDASDVGASSPLIPDRVPTTTSPSIDQDSAAIAQTQAVTAAAVAMANKLATQPASATIAQQVISASSVGQAPTAQLNIPAVQRAAAYVGTVGPWHNLCLAFVRTVFGLPLRQTTAIAAWNAGQYKHVGDFNPPAGVPVFWYGGTTGAGHIAVSMGNGWVVTTDLPVAGGVSEVPLAAVQAAWGLQYLGWTEDLEGVRVYTP